MNKLLYVESSPRKDRSASIKVARSFIDTFKNINSENVVKVIDLWDFALPEFDGDYINAKYKVLHGESPTEDETSAWNEVTEIVSEFKDADSYLFSVPMWNFSIPYKLKHFFDVITQPGLTFSFSPESGFRGLITGKPVTVIYACGGEYSKAETKAMDFQKPYLELLLGFIGFQDIKTILIEPTLIDPGTKNQILSAAKKQAIELASQRSHNR